MHAVIPAGSHLPEKSLMRSLNQGVREEQHERDDEAIDRQRLHEGKREQQHASKVIRYLWLPADAVDATARSDTLADARTDRRQADGEASANCRERWDPDAALRGMRSGWSHKGRGAERSCRQGSRRRGHDAL